MRNLGLIIITWLAILLPASSLALGLGEIEIKSYLNQPLKAEIQVISSRGGEIDDLLVGLATREAFKRAGLSRPRHLSELRFSVKKNEEGDEAVILVTTKAAIKEPFLNFLIEADWSRGRVLREFTVLLDPPFYANTSPAPATQPKQQGQVIAQQQPKAIVNQPVNQPIVEPIAQQAPVNQPSSFAQPIRSTSTVRTSSPTRATAPKTVSGASAPVSRLNNQSFGKPIISDDAGEASMQAQAPIVTRTQPPKIEPEPEDEASSFFETDTDDSKVEKGDTLWSIASPHQGSGRSMNQIMLAFQRANPDAFNDNNINNLKLGAVLRVPDQDEFNALGQQLAFANVLEQNGLWDKYVERVTGVSPAVSVAGGNSQSGSKTSNGSKKSSSELSLLLPSDAKANGIGTGDADRAKKLAAKLSLAEEELEASQIENKDLESKINELQAQLSKTEELEKMIQIESDNLAQLQENQKAKEALEQQQAADQLKSDEEALLEELLAEEAAAQAKESGIADEVKAPVTQANDQPKTVANPVAHTPSIFDGILPADIIAMIPSMPEMDGFSISEILADPVILGGLGGAVLLLWILIRMMRRGGGGSPDDTSSILDSDPNDMFLDDIDDDLTPIHTDNSEAAPTTQFMLPSAEDLESLDDDDISEADFGSEIDFGSTAIISAQEMPVADTPAAAAPTPAPAPEDQDDVLNEVDVYLAYGLYDNAEELLLTNLGESPNRADYRSKLLDTYFATKNVGSFVEEAQKLKDMGTGGSPYWDRVQVMGYELAPDNPLFSSAKDSGLSASDLEIAKPQEADFDLGGSDGEDDTDFSMTDFNLGDDDSFAEISEFDVPDESGNVALTQELPTADVLPDLDDFVSDDDDTQIRGELDSSSFMEEELELPDDIGGDLELSMDSPAVDVIEEELSFDLPDSLDLGNDGDSGTATAVIDSVANVDPDDISMKFDVGDLMAEDASTDDAEIDFSAGFETSLDQPDDADADMIPFDMADADVSADDTLSIEMDEPGLAVDQTELIQDINSEDDADITDLNLGLGDSLDESLLADSVADLAADLDSDLGVEDISDFNFDSTDFEEASADDSLSLDMADDVSADPFAVDDFEQPTMQATAITDIEDLMLPDDVDEVSTKLDLARAFIDMGDAEGARGSLEEVLIEGDEEQKSEAQSLLGQM